MLLFRNQQFMIVRYSNKSCLTKILTLNVLISCISLPFFCQPHVLGLVFLFKVLQPGNFITALMFTSHARHIRLRICDSLTTCNQQMRVLMQSLQPVDKDTQRPHNSPHKYTYKHEGTHHLLIIQIHLQAQTKRYTDFPRNSPRYLRHWQICQKFYAAGLSGLRLYTVNFSKFQQF